MKLDTGIIILYLIAINLIGLKFSRAGNIKDYFLGGRNIPWPVVCFSIVATETSTLTFISIPGLAYTRGLGFLQVALGYLIGRVLVAIFLLPGYFRGNIETAYEFLQNRFGVSSRKIISVLFHITRLLADSVRLFATAIPLSILTGMDYRISVILIGLATFFYTYYGGIKSVAFVDTVQMGLYIISAVAGILVILNLTDLSMPGILSKIPHEKTRIFSTALGGGLYDIFGSYNIFSGIIGGAFLSFASHGTDHIIVQRALSCRDLKSAKKAIIFSGFFVIFQFALFLMLGLFILVFFNNRHFARPDEILPFFIINNIPPVLRGLMLAGIFAAAMSTLSSSINSLSSSTVLDLLNIDKKDYPDNRKIRISRLVSLSWSIVLILISMIFKGINDPLVEIGLGIAGVTYGGTLGIFLLGRFFSNIDDRAALTGVVLSIISVIIAARFLNLFWPWFVPLGFTISFFSGIFMNKMIPLLKK